MEVKRTVYRVLMSSCIAILLLGLIVISSFWNTNYQAIAGEKRTVFNANNNKQQVSFINKDKGRLDDVISDVISDVVHPRPLQEMVHDGIQKGGELVLADILIPKQIPPNVHYLWCGRRWFEFRHYLSVLSVLRTVQPNQITIHYEQKPEIDKVYYHQWLDEVKHDYPWLVMQEMDADTIGFCNNPDRHQRIDIMMRLLSREGGLYVSENTLLLNFPAATDRSLDLVYSLEPDSTDGYVLVAKDVVSPKSSYIQALYSKTIKRKRQRCCHVSHVFQSDALISQSPCMVVTGEKFQQFYPMNIWEDEQSPFARLVRKIFYGKEEVQKPVPTYDELVPNIAHMIWLGGGRMDYLFYLSVLSLLFVAKVDTVYIHGDLEPAGEYWKDIMSLEQTKNRIKFIVRSQPYQIYQSPQFDTWRHRALMSDLIRCDLMIRYGGIYTDTDALWVKPLTREDRGYDAVASYDWVDWSWPYPDSVNFGISYGKRNAPFWRLFRESMRTVHLEVHGFTGVMMPYKLLEKYPHLLRIDRHLQVICYHYKCHPTYADDYHNMTKDHTNMNNIPNWRQDLNAFHWTHPNPPEYANRSALLKATGMFADMGKNVLQLAGLL